MRVDDLGADPVALELAGCSEGVRDERAEGDDGHVAPFANDASHAELDAVALGRYGPGLTEEELLLLEEDHRVRSLDRCREQTPRVEGV